MRLNRYLAAAGLGSRRSVESLILQGRVKINGRPVEDLGTVVQTGDVVKVGNTVVQPQEIVHAVLFKPRGFVCSADDERGRRTIFDLLPEDWPRVFHVGRLDLESEGLLIVTNDGDLSLALTHPRFKIEKEYEITLDKPFDPVHREKLLRGFHIEGGRAKMEEVDIVAPKKLRVILNQGIKRQIRLMLYDCGYEVENLRRVRIGSIWIEKLRAGMWRMLSPKDVADLKAGRSGRRRDTGSHSRTAEKIDASKKKPTQARSDRRRPTKTRPRRVEDHPTQTRSEQPSRRPLKRAPQRSFEASKDAPFNRVRRRRAS